MNETYFIPILIAGAIIFLLFLFFIIFYMFLHKRRLHLHFVEKERMTYDHNMGMLKARLDEQERVMTQISREIHDNVAQKVDFLQMNIKALHGSENQPGTSRALENSFTLAEQIGNDLRNISYSLNSDYVTAQGLASVIKKELSYIRSSKQIDCRIQVDGYNQQILPDKELLIYRIAQEAFHNCVKHSKASQILVNIRYAADDFEMKIADNGIGFDASSEGFRQGLGYTNMQHRANLMGARLKVESSPGKGCFVSVYLKCNDGRESGLLGIVK